MQNEDLNKFVFSIYISYDGNKHMKDKNKLLNYDKYLTAKIQGRRKHKQP